MSIYTIKRSIRFWWQRLTRGFDDQELWNLDWTLAKHILPRLKRFKELNRCYPNDLTPEQWDAILDQMIAAFEYNATDIADRDARQEAYDAAKKGMELFANFYSSLWW